MTFTLDSEACGAADEENERDDLDGSKVCMEACTDSAECASGLFCCPNWSMCFDTTTYGNYGPFCDASLGNGDGDGGIPEAPEPGQTWEHYALIEEFSTCSDYSTSRIGFYTDGLDYCAAACKNLGDCTLFYYDPNDGECVKERGTGAGCPEDRRSSNYYYFYQLVDPPAQPEDPDPEELPYTLVGENQSCSNGWIDLEPTVMDCVPSAATCYQDCMADENCFMFVFDGDNCGYDPQGRADGCDPADAPLVAGIWNMYNANKPAPREPDEPAPLATMIAES